MAKRITIIFLVLVACNGQALTADDSAADQIWRNPEQPIEVRVQDLLSRMTLDEKVSQMVDQSAAVERLGIPAYSWWSECLHGVARFGRATV